MRKDIQDLYLQSFTAVAEVIKMMKVLLFFYHKNNIYLSVVSGF